MAQDKTPLRLTSLLLVEERLSEADFFARRFATSDPFESGYFLNAFLSAARSVTFLLQKELAHVVGFRGWWESQRVVMGADNVARFFLEQRNFSQKQGRVSLMSARTSEKRARRWTYRFVGAAIDVPPELAGVDAAQACVAHVAKLAKVVLACIDAFPFHSCPSKALSVEGALALGLVASEVFEQLGYPYVCDDDEIAWRLISRQVDAVNVELLRKFAGARLRPPRFDSSPSGVLGARMLAQMEARLGGGRPADTGEIALTLLLEDEMGTAGHGPGSTGSAA